MRFPELPGVDNPFWDEVQPYVSAQPDPTWRTFQVGGDIDYRDVSAFTKSIMLRHDLVPKYSWTVTAPHTVKFVADNCTGRVIDPLAGTGYWAYLLGQLGITVVATDLIPPTIDGEDNHWHPHVKQWVPVLLADAVDAVSQAIVEDTLLLSWPPFNDPIAFKALSAFPGNRLIFIGEGHGGATGDEDYFQLLDAEWTVRAVDDPVQFPGLHDYIWVYDRNQRADDS